MLPENDNGSSDPRRYRRTLLPLEIEDAEPPLTLGRRLANLFRKKNRNTVPSEDGDPSLDAGEPRSILESPKRKNDRLSAGVPRDKDPGDLD